MNTSHLQAFITLAEAGSFSRAARRLFLTPPAVKYALDALESETGLTLFVRTHAGLELTSAGIVFADYATRILALADEGISRAANSSPDGRQRIDAPWMWAPLRDPCFHRAFAAFRKEHPDIDVRFKRVDSLIGEHFDAINGYADIAHTRAVGHLLSMLPLCCVVAGSHPLANEPSVAIEDLAPYDLLVPNQELIERMDERTQLFLGTREKTLKRMDFTTRSSEFYTWCIEQNRAVLVIGAWSRTDDTFGLQYIPIDGASFENCVFTQEHPSNAVEAYVDFMRAFYSGENACRAQEAQETQAEA